MGSSRGLRKRCRNPTWSTRKRREPRFSWMVLQEIAVLERIGPGPAAGKIIDGGGDDLHQVGEGLPHPQVQVEGHFRGHHPQLLVAAVKKEEVQMAAVFQGIDHRPLSGPAPAAAPDSVGFTVTRLKNGSRV